MGAVPGTCKLCGELKPLIKSHIIPKCFQDAVKDDRDEMLIVRFSNNIVKRTNDFLFDKEVLCAKCDNSFSDDENYTAKLLQQVRTNEISPVKIINVRGGRDILYVADQPKVKRCMLSILWRMSISKKDYFTSVDLGPLEDVLKSRLNNESFMVPNFLPVSIISLKNTNNWKSRILCADSPSVKFLGCRLYFLHLPDFLVTYYASKSVSSYNPDNFSFKTNGLISIGEGTDGSTNLYLDSFYKRFPT